MMKKNVLLTGGFGYIGSWFLDNYSEKYNIKVLDTLFFGNHITNQGIDFIKKDIREIEIEDLHNIDIVVHMAELSNDPLGEINKKLTKDINIEGTRKLIELSRTAEIKKFIYMSSCSVYGDSGDLLANEESPTNPLTEYAKAKLINEQFLNNNDFNFEVKILRNATAFGFSKNIRTDLVINDLALDAIENQKINVLSDGSPKRPFVHIGDICRFIKYLIEYDNSRKILVNVGDKNLNYSVKQIANIVSKVTSVDNLSFGKSDSDARSYFVDFTRISSLFPEFKFKFTVEDGIIEILNNIKSIKINKENSKRIKKIHTLINKNKVDNNLYWN